MTFILFIARQNDGEKGNGHFVTLIKSGMHLMKCISGHIFICSIFCFVVLLYVLMKADIMFIKNVKKIA